MFENKKRYFFSLGIVVLIQVLEI